MSDTAILVQNSSPAPKVYLVPVGKPGLNGVGAPPPGTPLGYMPEVNGSGNITWVDPTTLPFGGVGDLLLAAPTQHAATDDPVLSAGIALANASGLRLTPRPGVYSINTYHTMTDGADMLGTGGGSTSRLARTTFKCTTAAAGIEIQGGGGLSGRFRIDGNSTATTPFVRSGGTGANGRTFENITVLNNAVSGTHSNDLVKLLGAQNDYWTQCGFGGADRAILYMDQGYGGSHFNRLELTTTGKYHILTDSMVKTSFDVYSVPTDLTFNKGICEGVPGSSLVQFMTGSLISFHDWVFSPNAVLANPMINVKGRTVFTLNLNASTSITLQAVNSVSTQSTTIATSGTTTAAALITAIAAMTNIAVAAKVLVFGANGGPWTIYFDESIADTVLTVTASSGGAGATCTSSNLTVNGCVLSDPFIQSYVGGPVTGTVGIKVWGLSDLTVYGRAWYLNLEAPQSCDGNSSFIYDQSHASFFSCTQAFVGTNGGTYLQVANLVNGVRQIAAASGQIVALHYNAGRTAFQYEQLANGAHSYFPGTGFGGPDTTVGRLAAGAFGVAAATQVLVTGRGTTAARPAAASALAGAIYGNTDTGSNDWCDGTTWHSVLDAVSAKAVTIAYAATITPAVILQQDMLYKVGSITGALSVAIPTGTMTDGQEMEFRFVQDATGHVVTFVTSGAGCFHFGTDFTAAMLPSTANAIFRVVAKWIASASQWYIISITRGY